MKKFNLLCIITLSVLTQANPAMAGRDEAGNIIPGIIGGIIGGLINGGGSNSSTTESWIGKVLITDSSITNKLTSYLHEVDYQLLYNSQQIAMYQNKAHTISWNGSGYCKEQNCYSSYLVSGIFTVKRTGKNQYGYTCWEYKNTITVRDQGQAINEVVNGLACAKTDGGFFEGSNMNVNWRK